MSKQLNHQEFKLCQKKFKPNMCVILENLEHMENIGSAFRLADAFNVNKIYIIPNRELDFKRIEKTARNCTNTVPFKIDGEISDALNSVKKEGYTPVCVEICDDSKALRDCNFSKFKGIAFIVGNEKHGVSQEALNQSAFSVHIDMYGNNSSMNVATALAITLYKCSEDYFALLKNNINDKEKIHSL